MAFGVTPEATILLEVKAKQRADMNPRVNQEDDALLGQINGVLGNAIGELWEVADATYASQYPDSSSNQSLKNVASITGTVPKEETKSTVVVDCTLDGSFTLVAGSLLFIPAQPDVRFLSDVDVENPGGAPAVFEIAFSAETPGAVIANVDTLTGGPELVTGWEDATNPLDADIGQDLENDSELRTRRLEEVSGAGGSTAEAIRADVSGVEGVISVSVQENDDEVVDANGIPAKSFETIVLGGDDADIAKAIFGSKPSGIKAFGQTIEIVQNSEGQDILIGLTRPTDRDVWLEVDVAVSDDYPALGDDAVNDAVVAFGIANFGQGDDVVISQLKRAPFSVAGVEDVTEIRAGFAISPTLTINLVIPLRFISRFDTSRVIVASTPFVDL